MKDIPQLNEHNKEEYPPMHTTEHILNQTMIRLFGCGRAVSAHIERKKSKLDFRFQREPEEYKVVYRLRQNILHKKKRWDVLI